MANEVTKEEINALMTVQAKAVEQQVVIAERLKVIVVNQEKTLQRLSNGLAREITDKIKDCNEGVKDYIDEVKQNTSQIRKDTTWLKWLFGSVGLIVALSMIFVNTYWLSHRASTATAVTVAIQETLEDYAINKQPRSR